MLYLHWSDIPIGSIYTYTHNDSEIVFANLESCGFFLPTIEIIDFGWDAENRNAEKIHSLRIS